MRYSIELTRFEAIHTAVIRIQVPHQELSRFVPAACGEVWNFIRTAGLPKPGRHLAVYLDRQGTVEVGAEVPEPFTGNDRVHCSKLPAGWVAKTVHYGPYSGLVGAHAAIREWCATHGQRLYTVCWEMYGHWDKSWHSDPAKIRTDVYYLLSEAKDFPSSAD